MTRRWVSEHGGVFVKLKPGVDLNPFLTTLPNLKVNITDEGGVQYTLRNPGLVVRGISEMAEESGKFSFHAASLDPINVETNTPDSFERKALENFEKGHKEAFVVEQTPQGEFYRYMAPLVFEKRCNKCHAFQKLQVGDIRGGISVSVPMAMVNQKLQANRAFTITSAAKIFSRNYSIICRYGGEEFMIILPSIDLQAVVVIAERIRGEISASCVEFNGEIIKVTTSIGGAQMLTAKPDDLINDADAALYNAKNSGRNRVVASEKELASSLAFD